MVVLWGLAYPAGPLTSPKQVPGRPPKGRQVVVRGAITSCRAALWLPLPTSLQLSVSCEPRLTCGVGRAGDEACTAPQHGTLQGFLCHPISVFLAHWVSTASGGAEGTGLGSPCPQLHLSAVLCHTEWLVTGMPTTPARAAESRREMFFVFISAPSKPGWYWC